MLTSKYRSGLNRSSISWRGMVRQHRGMHYQSNTPFVQYAPLRYSLMKPTRAISPCFETLTTREDA